MFIFILSIGLKVQTARVHSWEQKYELFVAQTKAAGEAQQAKTKAAIAESERISKEKAKAYEASIADIRSKYNRLRASPGSGAVSSVPETARPVDDAARDQRLLDVLRHAEEQAEQLMQLQNWVKENANDR